MVGLAGCSLFRGSNARGDQPPAVPFDAQRAYSYLTAQTAFGPRNPGSSGHSQCRQYLIQQLTDLGAEVQTQDFTFTSSGKDYAMSNIIGVLHRGAGKRIVFGAHWDTRPFADQDPNPGNWSKPILGANDGASGVAVLLEVARALAQRQVGYEIVVVLFDGEDFGLDIQDMFLGSKHFASHMDDLRPDRAIVVDMVGDADLNILREGLSESSDAALVNLVWSTAALLGRDEFVNQSQGVIYDDHWPLINAGVPAIDIIDFDYPYWHTVADTDDKCSATSLQAVGEVLLQLVVGGKL